METEQLIRESITAASRRAEALAAVESIYRSVQAEIAARRPICVVSGKCCRFEEYGHRLYVTTLELAHFLGELPRKSEAWAPTWDGKGCPFQVNKLCGVHAVRPFGCRMFFCDPSSTEWQNALYERFHAELKTWHEALGVPYYYLEWRAALRIIGLAREPSAGGKEPQLLSPRRDSF